jgi:hypothetical protein
MHATSAAENPNHRPNARLKAISLLLFAALITLSPASAQTKTSLPAFAGICGIRVGLDTFPTLEGKLGRGLPCIGGHSHGGRLWHARSADCELYADGFYYRDGGARVVDTLSLTAGPSDPKIPPARLPQAQARFMGAVALGMTKPETLRLLKSKLPPPKINGEEWSWDGNGFVRVNRLNDCIIESWHAKLTFKQGKLDEILVDCDPLDHYSVQHLAKQALIGPVWIATLDQERAVGGKYR